jgi:hypothetical protein
VREPEHEVLQRHERELASQDSPVPQLPGQLLMGILHPVTQVPPAQYCDAGQALSSLQYPQRDWSWQLQSRGFPVSSSIAEHGVP